MPIESRERVFMFPLAQLAAAFAVGSLIGLSVTTPLAFTFAATLLCVFLSTLALLRRLRRVATVLVTLGFVLSGATLAALENTTVRHGSVKQIIQAGNVRVGDPVEITGVLEREPEIAPERRYLNLRVERIAVKAFAREASGVVALLVAVSDKSTGEFEQLDLRYGARIRVMTTLTRADNFRNPGVSLFTEYLERKGYDAAAFVKSPLLIERRDNAPVFQPLALIYEWRRKLQTEIDSRFSADTAGVLDAALLGNRHNLAHSIAERFREGGTFHVLVISGLHITFLGGVIFLITRRLTRNKGLQFAVSISLLWAYSLAVGAESSVVRAALMFSVVLMAPLFARQATSLNALGGVAIALLVWQPGDLFDPSFQLTFVSVLAIVLLAWPVLQKMSDIGAWRPTRETPHPPSCAPWLRSLCETLYWSERQGRQELRLANYSYTLFKTPLAEILERFHLQRALRYAFGAVVVSACVQLTLLPLLVVYFHRLSISSLLLNIGVSLLMAAMVTAAGAGLIIAQISPSVASPLIGLADALNWLMVHSVDPFARAGVASIRLPEYTGWAAAIYGLYYVPLVIVIVSLARWQPLAPPKFAGSPTIGGPAPAKIKKILGSLRLSISGRRVARLALLLQLLFITLIVIHPWSARVKEGELRVDFLDVGQGDAALVTFPDHTTLLIDGGGRPGHFRKRSAGDDDTHEREARSIGESVVSEYLWWRGLGRVDYLLTSHADADHLDGLNDVARNFSVRAALVARTPERDPEYLKFSQTLVSRGVPVRLLGAGDELNIGGVSTKVLWPPPSADSKLTSGNNDSLVLELKYGTRKILFTGDIEAPVEKSLLSQQIDLTADVVRVAHHGSRTSSSAGFIAATKARFALISVGQTSIFGHPHPEVVERWASSGAEVLTTGRSGMITVTSDGKDLRVAGFIPGG